MKTTKFQCKTKMFLVLEKHFSIKNYLITDYEKIQFCCSFVRIISGGFLFCLIYFDLMKGCVRACYSFQNVKVFIDCFDDRAHYPVHLSAANTFHSSESGKMNDKLTEN